MKKRIGLVLLLIAVTTGMAFAEYLRAIPYDASGDSSVGTVEIRYVFESYTGIDISYSCVPASSNRVTHVVFTFTAYYNDGSKPKTWTNTEDWMKPRDRSTWNFVVLWPSRIERVDISWKKK